MSLIKSLKEKIASRKKLKETIKKYGCDVVKGSVSFGEVITLYGLMYVAPQKNTDVHKAVIANYEKLEESKLRFIYLPSFNRLIMEMSDNGELQAMCEYLNPMVGKVSYTEDNALTYDDLRKAYLQGLSDNDSYIVVLFEKLKDKTSLVKPIGGIFTDYVVVRLHSTKQKSLLQEMQMISEFSSNVINQKYREVYHLLPKDEKFKIAKDVWYEASFRIALENAKIDPDCKELIDETIKKLIEFATKGIDAMAVYKLIGEKLCKPGRLLIDKNYRIWLPDFGNKEVVLHPASKAVFLLFLRHPEGIYFKELPKYKDELLALYLKVDKRESVQDTKTTIENLIDSSNNSINEKCSRIKCAFLQVLHYELASWYFIDGEKGFPKTIQLSRELVTWEEQPNLVSF